MVTSNETTEEMTALDKALETLRQDMNDARAQSQFYNLFLNSGFYVPTLDEQALDKAVDAQEGQILPLIIESEGNDYLMLFDTKERLQNWTRSEVKWVEVTGNVLAAITMPPLHWALNVDTGYSKQFLPDEIAWLREMVERCNAAAADQKE